ncbi:hypothetical protein [Candidatus Frankia alpina]|uniref:hypothetical protein n=1 Tax=Candidatus Frankia alpina TaxID=2699483 RepID=UPI0013D5AC47|nr:hypothetical protein [Candidatus Frankia alpina]
MWGTERELLVVLEHPGRAEGPLAALAEFGRVTSALPPRLALLAVPASRAAEVGAGAGVRGVFVDGVPSALRETLSPAEVLFVDGWLARRSDKDRPAQGRPWDAPGTFPPDPPPPGAGAADPAC